MTGMARRMATALTAGALLLPYTAGAGEAPSGLHGFTASAATAQRVLEARFDAALQPGDLRGWLERMAAGPNHVGSPHNRENAEFQLALFREWGFDARIETFDVLYPTPLERRLELLGPAPFTATLAEPPVEGDRTSAQTQGVLPPYTVYGADGDVTAPLVYVNYGLPDDYEALERRGISVAGKVVIARYGHGWRGLKPKLAQQHGAIGCLIYSDPADDGYRDDDGYPAGTGRPPQGAQRGSVQDIPVRPGDPLTPNVGAVKGARRLPREKAETLVAIPVLPISYADAQPLLAALGGPVAPRPWHGALGLTYHIGPSAAPVRLAVRSEWSLKPIHNVIAVLKGRDQPDQWVIRGNHRDAWVFGASDPISGQVALMAEAKAIGVLARNGWRPKRTLVYASWDGEEPGLLGSVEWAEQHAAELKRKAVLYLNSDTNGRGFLRQAGSHSLQRLVNQAAADVADPATGVPVQARLRARIETDAFAGTAAGEAAEAAARGADLPLAPLGSGSDYTPFLQHLGVPSLEVSFGGDAMAGVYHSTYDSADHHLRFMDPDFAYGMALARTAGRIMLRMAEAEVLPHRVSDFADAVGRYAGELRRLVDDQRRRSEALVRLLATNSFALAAEEGATLRPPAPDGPVPYLEFAPLDNAVTRLKAVAALFDGVAALASAEGAARIEALNAALTAAQQALLDEKGLPGRPWYRNLVYAPGLSTGYAPKTLPGIREAIEDRRWDDANRYIRLTARALEAYAARLAAAAGNPQEP